ncbi:hypothetical protein BDR22DRAFT_807714 [Usnea florida]
MIQIYPLLGVLHPFDPTSRFTTSWLLPPYLLASLRLLLALYAFTTIFTIFAWDDTHDLAIAARHSFSYFTNLTYWGLAFYFLFAALHTFVYARTGRAWLQGWPRPLQGAHAVFYTTVVTFPFLVTIVFWGVLYRSPWFPIVEEGWSNISQHALNSLFALLEIVLPRTSPPPPLHIVFLIVLLACYLALAYITHSTEGFYPYSFLDTSKGSGRVAGYCFGILAAICVIFGIVWGLIWLREFITTRKLGLDGKFAPQRRKANGPGVRERDVEVVELQEEPK